MSSLSQVKLSLASVLGVLRRDRRGNFAMLAAVLMVPAVGAAGMAIDISSLHQAKGELQNALDAGVLAVAAKKASTSVVDKQLALTYFAGNKRDLNVKQIDFVENADGTLTGTASIDVATQFMGIFGKNSMNLQLTSTANAITEKKLSQVTLNIVHAQGAYSKDIFFFTKNDQGAILSEKPVLTYRYDGKNRFLNPPSNSSVTVNVGDYATYGYSMVVYEDYKYRGALVNPKKYYSDDPQANKWTRKSGACEDPNGILNQWEDGGDGNYLDFQFRQICTSTVNKLTDVRLVK